MMKGIIATVCTAMVFVTAGCGVDTHNNHQSQGLSRMQDPTQDVTYKGPSKKIKQQSNSDIVQGTFGHTHYTRKPGRENVLDARHIPKTDYQALSDIVTRLELTLPDVYDVGTLVTDEYILIAYKTTNHNRNEAAEQVKRTALSVVPNYYKVYISDQPFAQTEIANYKDLGVTTARVHQWLPHLIKRMKEAPQGTSAPKASDNTQ
jgi:hypothetical protein